MPIAYIPGLSFHAERKTIYGKQIVWLVPNFIQWIRNQFKIIIKCIQNRESN